MSGDLGFQLSSESLPWRFRGGRGLPVSKVTDYEAGGIFLRDPSVGLEYQIWRTRVSEDETQILLSSPTTPEHVIYESEGIKEVSLTFDSNMRPHYCWTENGSSFLRWYDTQDSTEKTMPLGTVRNPRISLDDKRPFASAYRSILLAYIRGNTLYGRDQLDRFGVEYVIGPIPHPEAELIKIGLSDKFRFQYSFWVPMCHGIDPDEPPPVLT